MYIQLFSLKAREFQFLVHNGNKLELKNQTERRTTLSAKFKGSGVRM